jgi:ferric-dicitrate binding protein FerR (iron transport regulator)
MIDTTRAELLIQKYLDQLASPAETAELGRCLAADPALADAFARASRTDAGLVERFTEQCAIDRADRFLARPTVGPRHRAFPAPLVGLAAAVLFLAAALGLYHWLGEREPLRHDVVAGRVLVDGIESESIPDGAAVEVGDDSAAVIRLADGSMAELAPSSQAVIHGRMRRGGAVFELTRGGGDFQVEHTDGRFRVDTPVGKVTALGTEFSVELRPPTLDEGADMSKKVALALIVAVMAGNVEVKYGNARYALGIGDNRVYADKKSAPKHKPDVAGKVVAVAADGKSITVEQLPAKKNAPPMQRTLRLTEQTRLAYVNVPVRGEKPTIGYQVVAWLADGVQDTADAATFSTKKAAAPKPDLAGRVTAVSSDGKTLTVELPPPKKGQPASTATIHINDKTKLKYGHVPIDGEKPAIGYHAVVWLAEGSKDTAAIVAFNAKKGGPDFYGRVVAVASDGKTITVERPGKQKGQPATPAVIQITAATKLAYKGIEREQQRPAVGLVAAVWLEKESGDMAAGIQFMGKPAPPKPAAPKGSGPKANTPKPDVKLTGPFALPKGVQVTSGQQAELAAFVRELTPAYQALEKKKDGLWTADQLAARAVTAKAVKEAGLKDSRLVQEAIDTAMNVTPEQKMRQEALTREESELRQRFLDRLKVVLANAPRGN